MAQFDPPPALLAELAARWQLTLGPPLTHEGLTAWVAPARRGAERLVLKLAVPHDEGRDEAAGLRVWDGAGAVRLVEHHLADDVEALLLERCDPGTPLTTRPMPEQDEVVAGLLRRLWAAPPAGPFRPLTDMCAWWADSAERRGVPAEFADGLGLFRTLPREAPSTALLVTDLHAGNVLAAQRESWLMIDPKPYVGDPHYDVLQHLLNDRAGLRADPIARCARLAGLLDLDADRVRTWLYARCVQESPGHPVLLEVARRLR